VELEVLGGFVELTHKVLVLDDVRMQEILGYTEFCVHLLQGILRELWVIVDLPGLVYELPTHPSDSNFVDVGLRARPELLLPLDFEGLLLGFVRTVKYLITQSQIDQLETLLQHGRVLLAFQQQSIMVQDLWPLELLLEHGDSGRYLTNQVAVVIGEGTGYFRGGVSLLLLFLLSIGGRSFFFLLG